MFKVSKLAAVVAAILPLGLSVNAHGQSIEGVVLGHDGKAVAGANVEVDGTGVNTTTDQNGQFSLPSLKLGNNEIHVTAPNYAHHHQDIAFTNVETKQLTVQLNPSPIEVIDVRTSPIHLSSMESAIPVHVIGGEALRRQQAATLGDSLDKIPGVNTNFHAKVASTPIIRGLSGPRVLIAQNGLDVGDVSRVGPDHAVASEASTAEQIEVLRGPATLFYGSGAIGGVVNVVDSRIPTSNETQGEWQADYSSVDEQKSTSFNATTGTGNFAVYADGFIRQSSDYEIPVAAELEDAHEEHDEHEHEEDKYTVANSAEDSFGFTLGGSYFVDNGFVGLAVEQFSREYGIPGHSHGGEESHDEDEHDEHDHEEEMPHEEDVYADLDQTKVQLISELRFEDSFIQGLNIHAGYTDYEHIEIENSEVGTVFKNNTYELRADLLHKTYAEFNGGVSFHYKKSEVEAQGSEAFTPPSGTEMFAVALLEERHIGDVLLQFGGRVEKVTMSADNLLLPEIGTHGHEDDHDEDEHGHEEHDGHDEHGDEVEITRVFAVDHEFTPVSLSAGVVWDFTPGYNFGLSLSRAQRAPSASELMSFGPHIGTGTYEVGALFALEEHEGEMEFELNEKDVELETSNNIDFTFRKNQGEVGFIFNLYYNQVDNYYYQTDTGMFAEAGHDHGHEEDSHDAHGHDDHDNDAHEGEDEHSDELPVYLYQTDDVVLNGFEAQVAWQVTSAFKASAFSDFVRARLKDGGDLPRTPPLRFGTQFSYQNEALSAHLNITRYQSQDRIAATETTTDGYTLVDVNVSYDLPVFNQSMAVYFRGQNLTNQEARVHSSFLKDQAPRPGRNLTLGVKGYF